jgi:Uma2 family endonuclease
VLTLLNEMPSLRERALPLSVEAWHQMISTGIAPERAELIRGVIIEKMSKSILHFKLTHLLVECFRRSLGDAFWVRQEAPLTLADSEPEPDLSVVDGRLEDYKDHPSTARIVAEVSVSTLAEDRAMAGLYSEAGVLEFWLVNAAERHIEIYRNPANGAYQECSVIASGEVAESFAIPGLSVDVRDLFERATAA